MGYCQSCNLALSNVLEHFPALCHVSAEQCQAMTHHCLQVWFGLGKHKFSCRSTIPTNACHVCHMQVLLSFWVWLNLMHSPCMRLVCKRRASLLFSSYDWPISARRIWLHDSAICRPHTKRVGYPQGRLHPKMGFKIIDGT